MVFNRGNYHTNIYYTVYAHMSYYIYFDLIHLE